MNLKQILMLLGAVVAGTLILLVTYRDIHKYDTGSHPTRFYPAQPESATRVTWESKVDTQGSVTVVVTPSELSLSDLEWRFDIGLNTHSVELDQNMTKVAVLVDDRGNEYDPVRWEGAGPGGHHRIGVLVFKSIKPMPKNVELKIVGVDVPVRSFLWSIIN